LTRKSRHNEGILDFLLTGAAWSAIIYGIYKFYEKLTQDPTAEDRKQAEIQQMNEQIHILRAKLTDLIRTVNTVQDFLNKYVSKRDDNLLIIKKELTSLKSLMVSKDQFTDVPKIPKLPAWQTVNTSPNKSPTISEVSANSSDESIQVS